MEKLTNGYDLITMVALGYCVLFIVVVSVWRYILSLKSGEEGEASRDESGDCWILEEMDRDMTEQWETDHWNPNSLRYFETRVTKPDDDWR